jgi:hypothetical protein
MEEKRFNNIVDKKLYKKIEEHCINYCKKYDSIDYMDVLSFISEVLVRRNPVIENEKQFLGGWLSQEIKWEISKQLNKKKFSDNIPDLIEKEFNNELQDKIDEKIVNKLKNTKYWDFYVDKYIIKLNGKELGLKYGITSEKVRLKTVNIRNFLKSQSSVKKLEKEILPRKRIKKSKAKGLPKGRPKLNKIKEKKMRVYKGVAKYEINDDSTIIKVYPSANDVMRDGYSRESVSKCCNGKLKSHRGFIWKFVKNEEKENNKA